MVYYCSTAVPVHVFAALRGAQQHSARQTTGPAPDDTTGRAAPRQLRAATMLRLGGLAKGDMQQCFRELEESMLPHDFKLRQVRSLLRFVREVGGLVDHIKQDSGFEGDTTSYLEILCAKEESDLIRRVSHTRVLRQVTLLSSDGELLRAWYNPIYSSITCDVRL